MSEGFKRNWNHCWPMSLSIVFTLFLTLLECSAHPLWGADSERPLFVSYNVGSYMTSCSWPFPSVQYTALTFVSSLCHKAEILHKDYSQESSQRRKELYFEACFHIFPCTGMGHKPSIHLGMSPMHEPLVAEIPWAESNREIIPIRKVIYCAEIELTRPHIHENMVRSNLFAEGNKSLLYQIPIILLSRSSWHPCSPTPYNLTKFT